MRLVTYDRGGARRLGAWVDETVVDLPDAVGHPSFPTTMERLVEHSGGTILEAAQDMLWQRDVVEAFAVPEPSLLVPFMPRAARFASSPTPVLGPGDELPWPEDGWLEFELEIACIAGKRVWDLQPEAAEDIIFGYTIVNEWWVRPPDGVARSNGERTDRYVGFSFGPCVVTADEFDPVGASIEVRVDGRPRARGTLARVRSTFGGLIAAASHQGVDAGDLFGSGRAGLASPRSWHLRPGSLVEAAVEGIGVLRTAIGERDPMFARKRRE